MYWEDIFTLQNALTAFAWSLVIGSIVAILMYAFRVYQEAIYKKTVLHPDPQGRYPVIFLKNREGIAAFDQSKGWGVTLFKNTGEVLVTESPNLVLDAHRDIEVARADSFRQVPAQVQITESPAYTYAPSNSKDATLVDNAGNTDDQALLDSMLSDDPTTPTLPKRINFFEVIGQREPGHVVFGVDEQGSLIQVPIMQIFHQLVGGMSGFGKSVYLRGLIFQLLMEAENSNIVIGLADIENNTFPEFRDKEHVRWYAGNYVEIEHMTRSLLQELEKRKTAYDTFGVATPKDIERYNTLARRENKPELPIIVVVYDEFTALMNRSQAIQKRIINDIYQLALRARKYGIFLVLAGQAFKADVIDTTVIGQFGINLSFRVRTNHQSMSIIGEPGAEMITQPGQALLKTKEGDIVRIQALWIDDDELLDALDGLSDGEEHASVPDLVKDIILFSHQMLGNKVLFKEIDAHFRKNELSRTQIYTALRWMDDNGYTDRNERNGRILNMTMCEDILNEQKLNEQ